jgi:glucose/arabinose dehydrogenase
MHPFAIDAAGNLFIDLASATNACEVKNRMPHSPGHDPCIELETRGGIWRYDANKTNQRFSPRERFATGLRNGEGFDFDADGRLFVTQHGRDQLHEDWPELYAAEQGFEEPAEEVVILEEGADYGWPQCYYDGQSQKLVLAPEYGGDGGKKVGACAGKRPPVAAFPAHWAPNDLKIYKGTHFPQAYAPDATAPMPSARRSGLISLAANGCGAMGASRASRRRSRTGCRSRKSIRARCRRRGE